MQDYFIASLGFGLPRKSFSPSVLPYQTRYIIITSGAGGDSGAKIYFN